MPAKHSTLIVTCSHTVQHRAIFTQSDTIVALVHVARVVWCTNLINTPFHSLFFIFFIFNLLIASFFIVFIEADPEKRWKLYKTW